MLPERLIQSAKMESQIALVTGARRTGKTTMAGLLAMQWSLSSRRGAEALPVRIVDPDGQLAALAARWPSIVQLVHVDGLGSEGVPSWAPPGVRPWAPQMVGLVDEAQEYDSGIQRQAIRSMIRRSGPRGMHLVLTSQRPAELSSALGGTMRLVDWVLTGPQVAVADLDYLCAAWERVGAERRRIASLRRHEFLAVRVSPW